MHNAYPPHEPEELSPRAVIAGSLTSHRIHYQSKVTQGELEQKPATKQYSTQCDVSFG